MTLNVLQCVFSIAVPFCNLKVISAYFRHHAIAIALDRPFVFDGKPFIMQYEVNFQTGIECGGAYVKLLSQSDNLSLVRAICVLRFLTQIQLWLASGEESVDYRSVMVVSF